MSTIAKPHTFSANTTISPSEVNANFDTIYNDYNGSISASNLATDAVSTAKIADSAVTTAKINDDAVTAAKINFGGSGAGVWWEEIGRTTLGSAADTISLTGLAARKYLLIIVSLIPSGLINATIRFNNDSGNNYAIRVSTNNAADTTTASTSGIVLGDTGTADTVDFAFMHVLNIAAQEKLVTGEVVSRGTAGAGNLPSRRDGVGKWVNTSAQISRVDVVNGSTGDYASGSELIVLGHD